MKKKIFSLLVVLGLMIAGTASASLWNYYNDLGSKLPSISERADVYQDIADDEYTGSEAQNISLETYLRGFEEVLGATPTPTSSAPVKYVESPDFFAYSPAVSGDTTITINDLEDIYGNTLTMADFGDIGYGRIDPNGAKVSESFTFSGVTANSDGTFTLTGVKTVLAKYPYTQTSGLVRSHSINAIVRFTNSAAFYDNFANKENNAIIDGTWVFNATPVSSSSVQAFIGNEYFATQNYVNDVGAGGFTASNVSTTLGLEALGTSPETVGINASTTLGMTFDSNGALYQSIGNALEYTGNAIAVSTSTIVEQIATSTPTADTIPIADTDGKLDSWTNSQKALVAGETIAGATLPVAVYQNTTDNEFYACDGNDTDKMKYQGFAISDGTDGNPITVQFSGVVSGFTGLSEGEKYYVQDDKTIGITIGTYGIQVGVAVSETELFIEKAKDEYMGSLSVNKQSNVAGSGTGEIIGAIPSGAIKAIVSMKTGTDDNTQMSQFGTIYLDGKGITEIKIWWGNSPNDRFGRVYIDGTNLELDWDIGTDAAPVDNLDTNIDFRG